MPAWIAFGVKSSSSVASWWGASSEALPPQAPSVAARHKIVTKIAIRRTAEKDAGMGERAWTSYVAEFLGTFFLVLFICLTATITAHNGLTAPALLIIAGAHVIALAVGIYALGAISGAHFNPAVTTTLLALRKISAADAAIYIVFQVAGAICAALVVKL